MIAIVGCGSVGGWAALLIAGRHKGPLALVDREVLTSDNVRRHVGSSRDVGRSKVDVVTKAVRDHWPDACVTPRIGDVLAGDRADNWLDGSDCAFVAVDNESAKIALDAACRRLRIRAVYAGVYGAGHAVEVIHLTPDGPCYACAARSLGRVGVPLDEQPLPYQSSREHPNKNWRQADLTSILPCAALAVDRLLNGHAAPMAWRLQMLDTPAVPAWSLVSVQIEPFRNCPLCVVPTVLPGMVDRILKGEILS